VNTPPPTQPWEDCSRGQSLPATFCASNQSPPQTPRCLRTPRHNQPYRKARFTSPTSKPPDAGEAAIVGILLLEWGFISLRCCGRVWSPMGFSASRWRPDLRQGRRSNRWRKCTAICAGLMISGNGVLVVVGFGINVNHPSLPPELEESATSLLLTMGKRVDAVALAAALLQFFDREYRQLTREGLRPLLERFARRSSYVRGKRVLVGENGGYEGTTDGLDERGFLRVKTATGTRTVISGGVRAVET